MITCLIDEWKDTCSSILIILHCLTVCSAEYLLREEKKVREALKGTVSRDGRVMLLYILRKLLINAILLKGLLTMSI